MIFITMLQWHPMIFWTHKLYVVAIKPRRASPSYKIADCELSNSYLLTRKIFSSNRQSYNLVNSVGLYLYPQIKIDSGIIRQNLSTRGMTAPWIISTSKYYEPNQVKSAISELSWTWYFISDLNKDIKLEKWYFVNTWPCYLI